MLNKLGDDQKHTVVTNGVFNPLGGCHIDAIVKGISEAVADKRVRNLDMREGESYPAAANFAATFSAVAAVVWS